MHDLVNAAAVAANWKLVRSGEPRGAAVAARMALAELPAHAVAGDRVERHLIVASCAMRQGHHAEALQALDAASPKRPLRRRRRH
jgi:hypothetical protein